MFKYLTGIFLLVMALGASGLAKQPISLNDFVKLPKWQSVKISPSGKYLSVIYAKDGQEMVGVLHLESKKIMGLFGLRQSNKSVGDVHWVNDERIIYGVTESHGWDKTRFDNGELYAVNVDGSRHLAIFGYQTGQRQVGSKIRKRKADYGNYKIVDLLADDDKHILVVFYPWRDAGSRWVTSHTAKSVLYRLNVYSGKKSKLGVLPVPHAQALTDNSGAVRFASGINDDNKLVIFYRQTASSKWRPWQIKSFEGNSVEAIGFNGNNTVYLSAYVGDGTRALYQYDIAKQSIKKIYHHPTLDISRLLYDFNMQHIVGVGTELGPIDYHYLEPANQAAALHKKLKATFKGQNIEFSSTTRNGDKAVIFISSDTNPGDYYLLDTQKGSASYLVGQHQHIQATDLHKMRVVSITARDGQVINGYLTLPDNVSGQLPLIVHPHGGPHARDYWGYDWSTQLLASRGYGVLQINFRGSSGFGKAFELMSEKNWGTRVQDDITDMTRSIIDQYPIDAKKVCIYGSSFGGYSALMSAAREPELYRCAIGAMGVYSLPMMFTKGDIPEEESGLSYLRGELGTDKTQLKQQSPIYQAKNIKAAVLLIHGKQDKRVPIEQAYAMQAAFDAAGKPYQWLKLNDEGHSYYDEANRIEVFETVLGFLHQHIGPKN